MFMCGSQCKCFLCAQVTVHSLVCVCVCMCVCVCTNDMVDASECLNRATCIIEV